MPIMLFSLVAVGYFLYLAVAALLVHKYRQTRDVGFIWLGSAVLIWPLLARLLAYALGVPMVRPGPGPYFTFGGLALPLNQVQQVISLMLLFAAVFQLGKAQRNADTRAA